ncbi:MAG: hypothetical protein M5U34_28855 [Chloroflexi bacterium]|nr:hypothetical protein [Chloroflexota bacterium]
MIEIYMQTITAVWLVKILLIVLFYLLAWFFHRLSSRIATRLIRLNRFRRQGTQMRSERMQTLHGPHQQRTHLSRFFHRYLL